MASASEAFHATILSGPGAAAFDSADTLEFPTNGPLPDLIRTPKVIFSRLRKAQPHPGETQQLCALLWITDDLRPSRALPCLARYLERPKSITSRAFLIYIPST